MSNICDLFPTQTVLDSIPVHGSLQKHKCSAAPFSSICPFNSFSKPSCEPGLPHFPIRKHNTYQSLTFTLSNFVLPQKSFFQKKTPAEKEEKTFKAMKGERNDRELYIYKAPTYHQKYNLLQPQWKFIR